MDQTELVRQAQEGDTHAFALLYESVYKDLYRFALYTLHHTQNAEDAVSEAVTDAFAQIGSLRKAGAFKAWIFRILTAKCKRCIRRYANATEEIPEDISAPEQDLCENTDLWRAFCLLPEEDRLIISMNVFGGYSSQEIGDQLEMNANTVRSRQSRALKKLAGLLT